MKRGYFSEKVADWYNQHRRDLPWRNTRDPYKIWLSEIILQQTRVAQGLPYYQRFVECYPDVTMLARAPLQEVLRHWQGLGYYSRARNLHACARKVVRECNASFPNSSSELKKLPGIGDYTAAAIASIAFDEGVAVVDGNVYRVLARYFGIDHDIGAAGTAKIFLALANSLLPAKNPGEHNQAIMEFGALNCLPANPKCDDCPLRRNCVAFAQSSQHLLPVKLRKPKSVRRYFNYLVVRQGGKILMRERKDKDIWRGLFDFPLYEERKDLPPVQLSKKIGASDPWRNHSAKSLRISGVYKHVLTHQVIFARFAEADWRGKPPKGVGNAKWYSIRQVAALPKPKLIVRFFEDRGIL